MDNIQTPRNELNPGGAERLPSISAADDLAVMPVFLHVGMRLRFPEPEGDYRVLNVSQEYVTLCKLDVSELDITMKPCRETLVSIAIGDVKVIEEYIEVVDSRNISNKYRQDFEQRRRIMHKIENEYGPDFTGLLGKKSKPLLDKIVREEGVSKRTLWNWIRVYLQSGMSEAALLDKRTVQKGGRPSKVNSAGKDGEKWAPYFDDMIELYKTGKGQYTVKALYTLMLGRYFCEFIVEDNRLAARLMPKGSYPSIWQFRRYLNSKITLDEKDVTKLGAMEQRNRHRILKGSAHTGVEGAYDVCEMDAWEADFALRDSKGRYVGRPVVYMIKDVATRMIIAVSVSFDNNSVVACTNCIANLAEDKTMLLEQYGIHGISPSLWLTGYKPRVIRIDNGADFISEELQHIFNMLAITPMYVSPGSGSLKGVVERSFRTINDTLKLMFAGYGHITTRHDSNHQREAVMDVEQFTKTIYNYVVMYNGCVNTGIAMTQDMIEKKVVQTPAMVMEYYLSYSKPLRLPNGDAFLQVLLMEGIAKTSRRGLEFKGLIYFGENDQQLIADMYRLRTKKDNFPILYDPRNADLIYYVKDNQLIRVPLNLNYQEQKSFRNKTFKQVEDMFALQKETQKQEIASDLERQVTLYANTAITINQALTDNPNYSDTRDTREAREQAKQERSHNLALEGRIGNNAGTPVPQKALPDAENLLPAESDEEKYMPIEPTSDDPLERLISFTGGLIDDDEE